MILDLPSHEPDICFHMFRSFLYSLVVFQSFLHISYTFLVNFIPSILSCFVVIVNGFFSLFVFLNWLFVLIHIKAINICILVL